MAKISFLGKFPWIYSIELSDDGLSVLPGAEKLLVAGTAYEGTCIFKRMASITYLLPLGRAVKV
jgi:arabinan endo-1,5-alpha-L-arabinosidase